MPDDTAQPASMDDSPKGRILRGAAHLFVTRGFAQTTVRDLAAAVGMQSGSLFHHFRSKHELLEAVMVAVIELNTARMRAALAAASDPLQRLRALIRCELTSVNGETSEAMSLLLREWGSLDADAQSRVLVLRNRYERIWLDALELAAPSLVAIDAFIMRRFLNGVTAQTTYWFRSDGALSIDDLTELVMTLVAGRAA
jgi:AcrR family transcriptional regulator